ncbi:hypothetical protein AMS68_007738 [Peltaster fructicola]|uniref:Uncharacterized protein n=1 Tax=Peltaster fructicola TaxID=286661 RepID=A0A6H0Y5L5_9PEZI|nr:hypothetical protein AMS68_007738 [Peltaster fructicola]
MDDIAGHPPDDPDFALAAHAEYSIWTLQCWEDVTVAAMDEMQDSFTVVKAAREGTPRLVSLALPGRTPINTPHYLANTSRGVVPHLTQDNLSSSTSIAGIYASLEDS